jgi:hypothetical protein
MIQKSAFISNGHGLYHFYKVFGKGKDFRKKNNLYIRRRGAPMTTGEKGEWPTRSTDAQHS